MTRTRIDASTVLRPVTIADYDFMADLYASTREEEMKLVDWTDEQKRAFLRSQFDAQSAHYDKHYTAAERWIIERDGDRIGRLFLHYLPNDLRIVDIALIPSARGQGTGGAIVRQLLEDAGAGNLPVSIHVEINNPALRLYERLGFRPINEHGMYLLMEWSPNGGAGG